MVFRDRHEADPGKLRPPGIPIVLSPLNLEEFGGVVVFELIGARAAGLEREIPVGIHEGRRADHREDAARHAPLHGRKGLPEVNREFVEVRRIRAHDFAEHGRAAEARGIVNEVVDVGFSRMCVEDFAVGEPHALAELNDPGEAVLARGRIKRERGFHFHFVVEPEEALIEGLHDLTRKLVRRVVGVKRRKARPNRCRDDF